MEKVLSIIIPTYNMEKYLNKCLDSLLVPNKDLIEVLVIIDGSKDRSSEIAHVYEDKYPGVFRVIDKENGNYGSCINRGLKEASGKYVKVLDADDSFDTNNFEEYLKCIKDIDVDIILTDFVTIDEEGSELKISNYNLPNGDITDFGGLFKSGEIDFQINMHAITYKLKNLIDMQYTQTEGISYTDMEWCYTPMTKVNKGIYLKLPLYKYLLGRPGQTMDISVKKKQISQMMRMTESLAERFTQCYNRNYHEYLYNVAVSQISIIYKNALIDKYIKWDELDKYDASIKKINETLYYGLNNIEICKIKYIKMWRKYHNNFFQTLLNVIVRIKSVLRG